ncbi:UDP-glucosyl transferase 85A3 [Actinidia rufa]|uniref:UDP-glucosyl transferase 85A3 n=1 Tax=Actinidia rufa TaxID=165716 RepID=A0A7J0EY70_9ERIC|nr:UDP-glucosyl transferase 85A3 [Actinidia rufa]
MTPSDTTHVTGGTSLCSSNLNGPKQFFRVESHSTGTSWVASWWSGCGGSPSGIDSKRKSGRSSDGGVAVGADEAAVVEVGVDEGHVEATECWYSNWNGRAREE